MDKQKSSTNAFTAVESSYIHSRDINHARSDKQLVIDGSTSGKRQPWRQYMQPKMTQTYDDESDDVVRIVAEQDSPESLGG